MTAKLFETEGNAETYLDDNQDEFHITYKLCPLFRSNCKINCICYETPRVKLHQTNPPSTEKRYFIQGAYCTNVLIQAFMEVYNNG